MPNHEPASSYPFAVNFLCLIAQIFNAVYGHKFTYTKRLVPCFIVCMLTMVSLPYLGSFSNEASAYWSCFWALFIFGWFSGVAQGAIFGMAAAFPFKYMGAVMFGNGISGIGANGFRALTMLIWDSTGPDKQVNDDNLFKGTLVFFILCAGFLGLCLCC